VDIILQLLYIALAACGRHVAPVQEGMDINLAQTAVTGHFQDGIQVFIGGVHAAVGDKAHDVELFARVLCLIHKGGNARVGKKLPVLDHLGNAGQLLIDDPPGADVGVTHF